MKKCQSEHHLQDRIVSWWPNGVAAEKRRFTSPASLYRSCLGVSFQCKWKRDAAIPKALVEKGKAETTLSMGMFIRPTSRWDKSVYFCEEWDMGFSGAAWTIGRAGRKIIFWRKTAQFIRSLNCARRFFHCLLWIYLAAKRANQGPELLAELLAGGSRSLQMQ